MAANPDMAAPKKSRKNPRAQVSLVARYRSPTAFEFVHEECFDLSLGGMFIRSPSPAPAGTLIKLECDVNGSAGTIRGVARVVWLREHGSDNQPAGMGVKFVKLDPGAREAITSVLEQLGTDLEERDTFRPPAVAAVADAAAGPFRPTPSAAPLDEGARSGPARTGARGAGSAAAQPAPGENARPSPRPAAARSQDPGADLEDKITLVELALPIEVARVVASQPADPPARASSKAKPAAHADLGAARSTSKPGRARAAHDVVTVPPARAHSNRLVVGGALALIAAAALFVALSQQRSGNGAVDAPVPDTTVAAQSPIALPAVVPEPSYVLEVATTPTGARVTAGSKVITAPGEFDLGALDEPLSLTAESEGFEPSVATIDRVGFMLEDGAMRRRVELNLTARAVPAPAAPATAPPEPKADASPKHSHVAREPKTATAAPTPATKVSEAAPVPKLVLDTPPPTTPTAAETEKPAADPSATLTPLQAAAACLSAGDNACVIRALEGKAKSARELELLIETYRATDEAAKADSSMRTYLDKYPTERHANNYRRLLERRQGEAAAPH